MFLNKKLMPLLALLFCVPTYSNDSYGAQDDMRQEKQFIGRDKDAMKGSQASQVTATMQSYGTSSDVELTRQLRERLSKDESLSISAKNITIVTLDKITILKGEVANRAEKQKIAKISRSLPGVKAVKNELTFRK